MLDLIQRFIPIDSNCKKEIKLLTPLISWVFELVQKEELLGEATSCISVR